MRMASAPGTGPRFGPGWRCAATDPSPPPRASTGMRLLPAWVILASCAGEPPCTTSALGARCAYEVAHSGGRRVLYQVPAGPPPPEGFPVVLLFQGSLVPPVSMWSALRGEPWGAYHAVRTLQALLEAGFAVLTPTTLGRGLTCWNTNVPPWADDWSGSPDAAFMDALLDDVADGLYGPLDPDALYAMGLSSGGYMTSRMALAYPGRFTALAIVGGSWATCVGALCRIPEELPQDHPPTLFLHGAWDLVVPAWTSGGYARALEDQGIPVDRRLNWLQGHGWPPEAPDAVQMWFLDPG